MTNRDLVVASTRHNRARLLKYYPRPLCAPSFVKSRIFRPLQTHFLLFQQIFFVLVCIHPATPRVPPRVLAFGPKPEEASGPKPCGGNDIVYHPLPDYLMKRLQRVQKATGSFVLGRFVSSEDILTKLKWLPVKEQREWNLLKATHKALHNPYWPSYLKVNVFQHKRCLRSSNSIQLERSLINNTLQDQTASLFNTLPSNAKCCQDYIKFCKDTKNIIFKRALEHLA